MNIIKEMRSITGLSQSKFAKYFHMPVRTLQLWEIKYCKPTSYLQELMLKALIYEDNGFDKDRLKELKNKYFND